MIVILGELLQETGLIYGDKRGRGGTDKSEN